MTFFHKKFDTNHFTLYPVGDWHLGSEQCDTGFISQVIEEIRLNSHAYWVGMGDLMENAIVGSKSDIYTQTLPPREQMDVIVKMLKPIRSKGLFLIGGNHEKRSHREVGITPEDYISTRLDLPFMGFSCIASFSMSHCKEPYVLTAYFHHNYGGGYTAGGKINRAYALRRIAPTVDATFSGHFHVTSRIPVTWYEPAHKRVLKKTGYDYITGSALTWDESYAEEKAKAPATLEFIKVTFIGPTTGDTKYYGNSQQIYEVITPKGKK